MTTSQQPVQIIERNGTAAHWTSTNPVLAMGERGYETDTGLEKIGDGVSHWTALPYVGGATVAALATETTIRSTADTANLITATGRAAALALVLGG